MSDSDGDDDDTKTINSILDIENSNECFYENCNNQYNSSDLLRCSCCLMTTYCCKDHQK